MNNRNKLQVFNVSMPWKQFVRIFKINTV
jgi:hypothetical protein